MTSSPLTILADIGDLLELLVPVIFVIIYAIGEAIKKWLEKKEEQDRKKTLERIHETKTPISQPPAAPPLRMERPPAPAPRREVPWPPTAAAPRVEMVPDARLYREKPSPASPPRPTRQERLAEIQRKQEEYLRRISARSPAQSSPPQGIPVGRLIAQTPASPPPTAAQHAMRKPGRAAQPHVKSEEKASSVSRKDILGMLRDRQHLRTAFLLTEILGEPVALRDTQSMQSF